jgi:hypothetical protein
MTDVQEVIKIADSLADKTRDGVISWRRDPDIGDDNYFAETERFFYLLGSRDYDGDPPYTFQVWRYLKSEESTDDHKNLKMLDVVTTDQYVRAHDAVKGLIERARQNVAGLRDSLLDEVMRDLSGDALS